MATERESDERLWQFTPIDQYSVPASAMGTGAVRKSVAGFFRNMFRRPPKTESPLDPDIQLRSLSDDRLEPAIPDFSWEEAAATLDETLRPWLNTRNPIKPVVFYVAPPYAGREQILDAWSHTSNAARIVAPDRYSVCSGIGDWVESWPQNSLWVLPCLEECFLREASGLDSVRELLSRMLSGELGQGIVGCDSWAWEFLRRVWPGRPSYTVSAQGFDGTRLQAIFHAAVSRVEGHPAQFRSTTDGADILPRESHVPQNDKTPQYWKALAAACRGNIGVASAWWERSLRMVPEEEGQTDDESVSPASSPAPPGQSSTVWVQPVSALEPPSVPPEAGQTSHFVLHSLLVHGGLDSDTLARVLPGDRAAITEALLFLREAGLVERQDAVWRVAAFAYPAVRAFLAANEYLCDAF